MSEIATVKVKKVQHIYAWVMVHRDGSETLPNMTVKNAIVPLICSTAEGAQKFKNWAQAIANDSGCQMRLVRSNGLTELERCHKSLVEIVPTGNAAELVEQVAQRLKLR